MGGRVVPVSLVESIFSAASRNKYIKKVGGRGDFLALTCSWASNVVVLRLWYVLLLSPVQ